MNELESYVVAGEIHMDKILSGEEVILAVALDKAERLQAVYSIGDVLPLYDLYLSDDEENQILDETFLWDGSFGTWVSAEPVVGALVVFVDENADKYLCRYSDLEQEKSATEGYEEEYVLTLITGGNQALESWGFNPLKYTEVRASLSEDADIEAAEELWYEAIGKSKGVSVVSSYEIRMRIRQESGLIMGIFYILLMMLVLSGAFCVVVTQELKLKSQKENLQKLRKIGMSRHQITTDRTSLSF